VKLATAKIIEELGSTDHIHDAGLRKERVPKKLTQQYLQSKQRQMQSSGSEFFDVKQPPSINLPLNFPALIPATSQDDLDAS
jgi:hypothetical protein